MSFGDALRKSVDSELIEPPKGQYKVKIDEASAFETKAGDEYAKVILEITDGELAGSRFQHFMGFKNEIARQINGEALAAYGVILSEIEDITSLDDQMMRLLGTTADVGVSYNGDYIQIKVHGSRPPQPRSDIPSDVPEQPASFAAAAGQDNDDTSSLS